MLDSIKNRRGKKENITSSATVIPYLSIYQKSCVLQNGKVLGEGNKLANQF